MPDAFVFSERGHLIGANRSTEMAVQDVNYALSSSGSVTELESVYLSMPSQSSVNRVSLNHAEYYNPGSTVHNEPSYQYEPLFGDNTDPQHSSTADAHVYQPVQPRFQLFEPVGHSGLDFNSQWFQCGHHGGQMDSVLNQSQV